MRSWLFRWRGAVIALQALILLALARPSPPSLALGACLCLAGEALRLWAIGYAGEPTRSQSLEAPRLVTAGPYSLVRNPLYLGNLLNALGVTLAAVGGWPAPWAALGLSLVTCSLLGCYGSIITLEEEFLLRRFGPEYSLYRSAVPALWPRRWSPTPGVGAFSRAGWRFEASSLFWMVAVWAALWAQRGTP